MFPQPLGLARRELAIGGQQEFFASWTRISILHRESPFGGARKTRQGSTQEKGNGAQRDSENFGDLPIPEPFGAQGQTAAVLFRERAHYGAEALLLLAARDLVLGVRGGIYQPIPGGPGLSGPV